MRNTFLLLVIFIVLTSCAGMEGSRKSMSGDLGSPEKAELLGKRAKDFWSAFVNEDHEKAYNLFDPFFQAKIDKKAYIMMDWKIKYHSFEIKDVTVEGNVGDVRVSIVYSVPQIPGKPVEMSKQETQTEFSEKWLYIYDNWYKEYKIESLDKSFVYY